MAELAGHESKLKKHRIAFEEEVPHFRNQSCEQLLMMSTSSVRSHLLGEEFS